MVCHICIYLCLLYYIVFFVILIISRNVYINSDVVDAAVESLFEDLDFGGLYEISKDGLKMLEIMFDYY